MYPGKKSFFLSYFTYTFYSVDFPFGAAFFLVYLAFSFYTFSLGYVSFLLDPLLIFALFLAVAFFLLF
jgi:hypothetical protein